MKEITICKYLEVVIEIFEQCPKKHKVTGS